MSCPRDAHIGLIKDRGPETPEEWARAICHGLLELAVVFGICALFGLAVALFAVGLQK